MQRTLDSLSISSDRQVGLYDPDARFEYGLIDDFGCLETGNEMGDCRPLDQINRDGINKYISCCHFIPEVWESDITKLQRLEEKNVIEPPQGVGTIGEQWWYVPKVGRTTMMLSASAVADLM
jgi:hypothetical protein